MTYKEVMLSISGLRARDRMIENWFRRTTYVIAGSGMGGKEVTRNYERIWPDPSGNGKVVNVSQRALDQLRKFREAEAMKKAIKKVQEAKNNGGT